MCRKRGAPDRLFAALMAVQFFLLLDMAFDLRWKFHAIEDRVAMAMGVYDQRRGAQLLALSLLSLALISVSYLIFLRFRDRAGAAIALTGTLASVGLWCCEWVSYHDMDRFLYRLVGAVMVVSLIWIGFAMVTCFGVWLDGSSHSRLTA
jgi:hypothetical protein